LALRPRAIDLARVFVDRPLIRAMHRIDDQAELRILERHCCHRDPVGALIHAVERCRQASIFGRRHVQDEPELDAPGAQRALPISRQLRLRLAHGRHHRRQHCDQNQRPNHECLHRFSPLAPTILAESRQPVPVRRHLSPSENLFRRRSLRHSANPAPRDTLQIRCPLSNGLSVLGFHFHLSF